MWRTALKMDRCDSGICWRDWLPLETCWHWRRNSLPIPICPCPENAIWGKLSKHQLSSSVILTELFFAQEQEKLLSSMAKISDSCSLVELIALCFV